MLKNKACYSAIVIMVFLINATVATSIISVHTTVKSNNITGVCLDKYTNITVEEVYAFVTCPCNGIQVPIDVRTEQEWVTEHIQTPAPEDPQHHCLYDWDNESVLQQFIDLYRGQTIILYCGVGGRSTQAAEILVANDFYGTIYNMIGGLAEWKLHEYPTIGNLAPTTPVIQGITGGTINEEYEYVFQTTDPENNDIYYYVQWGDGNTTDGWAGPYPSGESLTLNHTWTSQGLYNITAKAKDSYGTESDWGVLAISMPKIHVYWFAMQPIQQGEIVNITPLQAWDMLNSEEDGRQLVIDDRTFEEYYTERLDTPHLYDKPIIYPLQLMQKPFFLQVFITLFNGKDIIIYCRTSIRSYMGATLLIDNGFQGTIYNMMGGINEWKSEGLPTIMGLGFGNKN